MNGRPEDADKPLMRSLGEFFGHVVKGIRTDPKAPPARPAPISARDSVSVSSFCEAAKPRQPSAEKRKSPDWVRRGPKRSSRSPTGSCIAA